MFSKYFLVAAVCVLEMCAEAAPLLHSFPFNESLTGRTKSMATDGSNVAVALYFEISHTVETAVFRTDSDSIYWYPSKPCVGVPYVTYGASNFLLVWLEGGTNSVDLHGQFLGKNGFIILAGLPMVNLSGLSWNGQSFLVLWKGASNGISSVEGQLLDPNGFASGAPMKVNSPGANATECAVAGAINHLVVWMESTGITNEWHTRLRTIDAGGSLSEIVSLSSAPAMSANPVSIASSGERAMAVWNRESGPYVYQDCCSHPCTLATNYALMLYGRTLNSAGSPETPEFQISNMGGAQTDPKTVFDGSNFVVIWSDYREFWRPCSSSNDYLHSFGQQVSSSGALVDTEFSTRPGRLAPQAVARLSRGILCAFQYHDLTDMLAITRISPADLGVMGFRNLLPASNGFVQAEFTGTVSKGYYNLQVSTNLSDWSQVIWGNWRVALRPDFITQWRDPFSNSPTPKFYRAVNSLDVCVSNLTLLQHVRAMWAFENAREFYAAPADSDLFGPNRYLPSKPVCPNGGTYLLYESPYCSVTGHTLY